MKTKICTKCKEEKSIDQFSKDKKKLDDLCIWCKECSKNYLKDYYQKNKHSLIEKYREYTKKYRIEHDKEIKQKAKIYREKNKERFKEYRKTYRELNKLKIKNSRLKRGFGITLEQYNEILKEQNNACAICGKLETAIDKRKNCLKLLAVDHDHKTGKIRGLLCGKCNAGLGYFLDNIESLKNAINYLEK